MNWYWNWINRMAERSTYALAELFGSKKLDELKKEIAAREQERLDQATVLQKPLINLFSMILYGSVIYLIFRIYKIYKNR